MLKETMRVSKRGRFTMAVAMLALAATLMAGQVASAQGIQGSVHDFSDNGFTDEICVVCHTPHNANSAAIADGGPLWNRELTTSSFTVYGSATFDATITQPDGISKLCLGCHDGSIAIDSFGGATGTIFVDDVQFGVGGTRKLGTDLANDHPVSMTFDTALLTLDAELFDPSVALSGITAGKTIQEDMLFDDKVQCASCHDVHDKQGNARILRKDNAGSALCLTCHDK